MKITRTFSHTKEVKRRGDMSSIYAQQLPPVAVAITTENDEEEGKREIALHQVFGRIPEVGQNILLENLKNCRKQHSEVAQPYFTVQDIRFDNISSYPLPNLAPGNTAAHEEGSRRAKEVPGTLPEVSPWYRGST